MKCSDRPVSNIIPEKESRTLEYSHHRYCRIHSKLPRPPPVTGAAYIGTLQNRTCFNGETGWLRNFISVPERGRIFFIQKHFKLPDTFADIEKVEPDETDLIMLKEIENNPDCHEFISQEKLMKELNM